MAFGMALLWKHRAQVPEPLVHDVIAAVAPADSAQRFTGLGVRVICGRAKFLDRNAVVVDDVESSGSQHAALDAVASELVRTTEFAAING